MKQYCTSILCTHARTHAHTRTVTNWKFVCSFVHSFVEWACWCFEFHWYQNRKHYCRITEYYEHFININTIHYTCLCVCPVASSHGSAFVSFDFCLQREQASKQQRTCTPSLHKSQGPWLNMEMSYFVLVLGKQQRQLLLLLPPRTCVCAADRTSHTWQQKLIRNQ